MRKYPTKITLDEYIQKMFPCSCAGFYLDKGKIDPHCFSCHNAERLKKALLHVRERSMAEAKSICNTTCYINEKGGITIPPFVDVDKDKFFVT